MAKQSKTDALVCVVKVTAILEPNGYDAAVKAIEALTVDGATVEIMSKGLARVPAPAAAKVEPSVPAAQDSNAPDLKQDEIPAFLRKPKL